MALTEAETRGRSAQMNVPKGPVLFPETPDRSRDENGVEMMASGAAACRTAPETVVNLQEEMTRTAEPIAFQVSADKDRSVTHTRKHWSWKVRSRPHGPSTASGPKEETMFRKSVLRVQRSKTKKEVATEEPSPYKKKPKRWDWRGEDEMTHKQPVS